MKRIVAFVLLLVFVLTAFASCSKNEKKKDAKFDLVSTADPTYDYYHNDLSLYITVSREDYANLTVSLDITDKEVEDYLNDHLLPSYRTPNLITDQAVKDGDTVYLWYTGYIDDVAFEGGSNAESERPTALVIGSNSFVDTFETQLIGVIPKDTSWENPKVVNVTFPDSYKNADLAGKAAKFDVVVAGVFDGTYTVPELTEEFARSINNFTPTTDDPVAEFKLALKDWLREQTATDLESRKFNCLIEKLFSTLTFSGSVPQVSGVRETARIEEKLNDSATGYYQQSNLYYYMTYQQVLFDSLDDAARYYFNLRFDADWKAYIASYAYKAIKQLLVLNAVAQLEGVEITEQDVKNWIRDQVDASDDESTTVESFLESYSLEEIYAQIACERAREILLEKVTFDATGLPTD